MCSSQMHSLRIISYLIIYLFYFLVYCAVLVDCAQLHEHYMESANDKFKLFTIIIIIFISEQLKYYCNIWSSTYCNCNKLIT